MTDKAKRKKDYLLIAALLLTALLLYGGRQLAAKLTGSGKGSREGDAGSSAYAIVRVDGKEAGRWPLWEETAEDIDTHYGHNRLRIKDGTVYMEEADCPDGCCMQQHAVSTGGGTIICLPHHLVITVEPETGTGEETDTVAS